MAPNMPPFPYVWEIPNKRMNHTVVSTNTGAQRAWRAPNHPQAALLRWRLWRTWQRR